MWVRGLDLVLGLVIVGIGFYFMVFSSYATTLILSFFAIGLLFIGIVRTVKSITMTDMSKGPRFAKLLFGLLIIGLSALVILLPTLALSVLILLVALSLMMSGMSRLVIGYMEKELAMWARGLYIIVGLVAFCVGFIAGVFPNFGYEILVLLISATLIFMGAVRITSGVTGELR